MGRGAGLDDAQGFWAILIPHGLQGGALAHVQRDDDVDMTGEEGWKEEYTQWWFDFLNEKGGKGVSKDTWQMVSARGRAVRAAQVGLNGVLSSSWNSSGASTRSSRSMTRRVSASAPPQTDAD